MTETEFMAHLSVLVDGTVSAADQAGLVAERQAHVRALSEREQETLAALYSEWTAGWDALVAAARGLS